MTTPYRVYADEWDPRARRLILPYTRSDRGRELAEIEAQMQADARRMEAVIAALEQWGHDYTADELMARYRAVMTGNNVGAYVERLARKMELEGQVRTARCYRTVSARFENFYGRGPLSLDHISSTLVGDFAAELKAEGRSANTISFYMRTLRAIYHKAVAEGRTSRRVDNPFAGVYTGIAATRKLALSQEDLAILSSRDPTAEGSRPSPHDSRRVPHDTRALPDHLAQALAMFLFSYHARGMCFVDMAFLRKSDLAGNTIRYRRQKTGQTIEIQVLPPMRRIIEWFWHRTPGNPYMFPIIADPAKDPMQQYESGLRLQNQRLKKVAERCGIDKNFSTHSARHSWATVAKSAALPLAVISEGLGHTNQKTTEIYLASLERSILDSAARVVSEAIIHGPRPAHRQDYPLPTPPLSGNGQPAC